MLIPAYMYSAWSLWDSIIQQQSKACALLLALCTAMTLIPAWLIEFRYFCAACMSCWAYDVIICCQYVAHGTLKLPRQRAKTTVIESCSK